MGHTTESLLATAAMWVKRAHIFEQLDHSCEAYREYARWRDLYNELKATTA